MRITVIVVVLSACCFFTVFGRMPPKPFPYCRSNVIGPACSNSPSKYDKTRLEPCKPGYTCKRGRCCRDPVCPRGMIEGPSCNLLPGQQRCPDQYQCINNFCCRDRRIVPDLCPKVKPPRVCPTVKRLIHACNKNTDCRGGVCCKEPCGRRFCYRTPPTPFRKSDGDS